MTDKINIELEEWQVRTLRSYFGQNDETQVAHWAFKVFDEALKQQCDIPVVVGRSEQLNSCDHKFENLHCDVGWAIIGKRCTKCGKTI